MISPLRLLWLISLPMEVAAGWLLVDGPSVRGIVTALALHFVAVGIFGFSLIVRTEGGRVWAWALLGWTLSLLIFPLLGMMATMLAFALTKILYRRPAQIVAELEAAAEPESPTNDFVEQARELEISFLEEREIEPVLDVLQEDDPEAKRAAIEALAKQRDANTVRLLRGLLHDPTPEARFWASITLSKLEDEIGKSILSAQQVLSATPDLPEARERLGQLYLDYAVSGFLEGVSRDYYLGLALEMFEDALKISPHPDRITLELARVHLLLGNIAQAAALLDDLAERRPNDASLYLARMEVIYEFGDFSELSSYARRVLPHIQGHDVPSELVEWWAGTGEAESSSVA